MICRTLSIYWLLWYPKPISSPSIHKIFQEKAGETRTEFLIEETKQTKTTNNKQEPKWNQQRKILPKGLGLHFELNKEGYKNTAVLPPLPLHLPFKQSIPNHCQAPGGCTGTVPFKQLVSPRAELAGEAAWNELEQLYCTVIYSCARDPVTTAPRSLCAVVQKAKRQEKKQRTESRKDFFSKPQHWRYNIFLSL